MFMKNKLDKINAKHPQTIGYLTLPLPNMVTAHGYTTIPRNCCQYIQFTDYTMQYIQHTLVYIYIRQTTHDVAMNIAH